MIRPDQAHVLKAEEIKWLLAAEESIDRLLVKEFIGTSLAIQIKAAPNSRCLSLLQRQYDKFGWNVTVRTMDELVFRPKQEMPLPEYPATGAKPEAPKPTPTAWDRIQSDE